MMRQSPKPYMPVTGEANPIACPVHPVWTHVSAAGSSGEGKLPRKGARGYLVLVLLGLR